MDINTYRIRFMMRCPNNNHVISYALSIESAETIMVEDIITAVQALPAEGFQEDIAAKLKAVLPGLHTIIAHHHGVDIETLRGNV